MHLKLSQWILFSMRFLPEYVENMKKTLVVTDCLDHATYGDWSCLIGIHEVFMKVGVP